MGLIPALNLKKISFRHLDFDPLCLKMLKLIPIPGSQTKARLESKKPERGNNIHKRCDLQNSIAKTRCRSQHCSAGIKRKVRDYHQTMPVQGERFLGSIRPARYVNLPLKSMRKT